MIAAMSGETKNNHAKSPARILVATPRRFMKSVVWAYLYELEDIIGAVDHVDFVHFEYEPGSGRRLNRKGGKIERVLGWGLERATRLKPIRLQQDYDLFFCVLLSPFHLNYISAIQGLRDHCRSSACLIIEVWKDQIEQYPEMLRVVADFDDVYVGSSQVSEVVGKVVSGRCEYLPPSIDAIRFCPWPNPPNRTIDMYQMGRRSPKTHDALMEIAARDNFFYYFDSTNGSAFRNYADHRIHLANLIKRSSFFVANRAKADLPKQTNGQDEIGLRFFEGAAAGAVMIGDYPKCPEFHQYFDWPDAVIQLDFGSTEVGELIRELEAQPERLTRIRHDNVVNSLRRYDFLYRWDHILARAGLRVSDRSQIRRQVLAELAKEITPAHNQVICRKYDWPTSVYLHP